MKGTLVDVDLVINLAQKGFTAEMITMRLQCKLVDTHPQMHVLLVGKKSRLILYVLYYV